MTFLLLHYAGTTDEVLVNPAHVEVVTVDRSGDVVLHFAGGSALTVSESFGTLVAKLDVG